jgi:hypothetical protein
MDDMSYLTSAKRQFQYYKKLADGAMLQMRDEQLFVQPNEESNSIAIIVKHLAGNMLSRWTDFLTTDGEKPWRNRDSEFVDAFKTREEVTAFWEKGWNCLFNTLDSLTDDQLETLIYIRNEGHTVMEAINRQLCHYAYHCGQIVYVAKWLKNTDWESLSIPRNKSLDYNSKKFGEEKGQRHFTDGV